MIQTDSKEESRKGPSAEVSANFLETERAGWILRNTAGGGGSGLSRHWEMPQHGNAKDLRKQEGKVGWKLPKFYMCNTSVCPDWTLDRCQSLSLSPTLEGLFLKRLYRPPGGNSVSQYGAWKFRADSSALLSFGILHRNKTTSLLPPFPGEKPERLCPCSLNFPSASYCFNLNLKY